MAKQLLKDTCALAAEILDGKHDSNLEHIIQAAQSRKKNLYRRGMKVRVVNCDDPSLNGQVGTVIKVNSVRVSVGLGAYDPRFGGAYEREIGFPPRMLEVAA